MKILLGVDTGGTFTDFVLYQDGTIRTHKVLSTPQAPEQAILQGIHALQLEHLAPGQHLYIVHGSTVATNAVLEGKGVRTALITNRGLRDILTIGRQTRRELFNLQPGPRQAPVPREACLETGGRISAQGEIIEPLTDADLAELVVQIRQLNVDAVAINLLFSYLDDRFERRIEAALPSELFVSRSSRVLPEFKEYERGMTTWLNAYVGPLVKGYLQRLKAGMPHASLSVMQSSGGTIAAEQAGDEAVHMLLSGPAGGLAAARYIGQQVGEHRLLTFDMGGTSTDVALIDGELQLTSEGRIGDYPVAIPMVDMHTIGAGGGSLARLDAGGVLQVGPQSAGADPGPACYGRGGTQATVTDANLVLGRLRPDAFLGGAMSLDVDAAHRAVAGIANRAGLSVEATAEGIIRIANEHMAQALRVISVQRGIDPRQLSLVSFGGAGGLHVCALAEALNMRRALVPVNAGVLSALGMLVAPRARQLSRTLNGLLADMDTNAVEQELSRLIEQGMQALEQEGVARKQVSVKPSLDLRYQGQSYYLNIPWSDKSAALQAFHALHEQRYGHQLSVAVELVNVRVALHSQGQAINLPGLNAGAPAPAQTQVDLYGIADPVPVYARDELVAQQELTGPVLLTEKVSTTYLAPGWRGQVHHSGCLMLTRM